MLTGLTHLERSQFDFFREPGILLHYISPEQSRALLVSIGNSKCASFHFHKSDWRAQIRNPEIEEHTGITCENVSEVM